MLSLLSVFGREAPMQVDAATVKKSEFVQICSTGFLLWVRVSLAMPLPLVWCCRVLWVTVELQSSCAWVGSEQGLSPGMGKRVTLLLNASQSQSAVRDVGVLMDKEGRREREGLGEHWWLLRRGSSLGSALPHCLPTFQPGRHHK